MLSIDMVEANTLVVSVVALLIVEVDLLFGGHAGRPRGVVGQYRLERLFDPLPSVQEVIQFGEAVAWLGQRFASEALLGLDDISGHTYPDLSVPKQAGHVTATLPRSPVISRRSWVL